VRASGSLLAGDLTTTLRASQSSPGMETRAGEAPWDAALASSIAVMALTMTVGSRSGRTASGRWAVSRAGLSERHPSQP
jgi:hypothetical protein